VTALFFEGKFMLHSFRLCLPALVLACAAPAALAQVTILGYPSQYAAPSLLGTDGNLYGTGAGGMFEFNLRSNIYAPINPSLTALTLCSIAPDGIFLGLNGDDVVYVTMEGVMSTLAALPYPSVCPAPANDGNYYGGSAGGGTYGAGYLYQLTPAGKVTVLYSFTGKADGYGPGWPMLQGSDGNLYGVGYEMFRYTASGGVTAFSSTNGITGPLFEGSSDDFYAINGTNIDTITPQGAVTAVSLGLPSGTDISNGNLFLGGAGSLYLEQNYSYEGSAGCPNGNFLELYAISPTNGVQVGGFGVLVGNEGTNDSSDFYTISEFLAGNGNFYGGYSDASSSNGENQFDCESNGTYYNIYSAAGNSVPAIEMTLSANRILPGKSTVLTWAATSAFSDNLRECYGYGGLSGKVATSGSQSLTYAQAGTYTAAVVCGGTQTGIAQVVVGGTQVELAASVTSNTVVAGQPVTFTATIENQGTPVPTGKVEFLDGSTLLAASTMNGQGVATLTASTTGIAPGTYSVVAKYLGDGNYSATTSAPYPILVTAPTPTATILTTSTPSLTEGQTAYFTVNVTNGGAYYAPTGAVTLYLGPQKLLSGDLYYYDVFLSGSTAGVAPGTYSLTAKYAGDANNAPSSSSPLTVTVEKVTSDTVIVSATPNPVPAGDAFTLSATVTGNFGTPTGSVVFSAGSQELAGTTLNGSGVATANIPAGTLAAGTYSITAAYAGDSKYPAGTSAAYSLTVQ
jgi:uncharacterized repeat protein (TIGR03803 family)